MNAIAALLANPDPPFALAGAGQARCTLCGWRGPNTHEHRKAHLHSDQHRDAAEAQRARAASMFPD